MNNQWMHEHLRMSVKEIADLKRAKETSDREIADLKISLSQHIQFSKFSKKKSNNEGEYDDILEWPFQGEVTVELLNQLEIGIITSTL